MYFKERKELKGSMFGLKKLKMLVNMICTKLVIKI